MWSPIPTGSQAAPIASMLGRVRISAMCAPGVRQFGQEMAIEAIDAAFECLDLRHQFPWHETVFGRESAVGCVEQCRARP